MSNWIQLRSGRRFYFTDPEREPLLLPDIVHALSNTCRFGGHCDRFYSVAEHSVRASLIVPPEFALEALLHDAAEAVLGDIPRPLKALLPDYRDFERDIDDRIRAWFDLPASMSPQVNDADLVMLATERSVLLRILDEEGWECLKGYAALTGRDASGFGWTPERSRMMFMKRYAEVNYDRVTQS